MQPGLWPKPTTSSSTEIKVALGRITQCSMQDRAPRLHRQNHRRQCVNETSYTTAGFYSEPYTVYSQEREIGS